MATNEIINASNFLIPAFNKNNKIKLSNTVMQTPIKMETLGNNKCIPIAMPTTSAKSQAAIEISANTYKK